MTDWESRYQIGDTPWDKGRAAPPLLEWLLDDGAALLEGKAVLVPGCGTGHDVRALAPHAKQVLGVDLAASAISAAREFAAAGNEHYALADFLDESWQAGQRFDLLFEHTCFCAIDPTQRMAYARAAAALIVPSGCLAGIFFLNPYDPGDDHVGPPFGSTLEEIEDTFRTGFELMRGWMPSQTYAGREGREWFGIFRRRLQAEVA
ncbi:MAG: methyltransferase domain-containing protein [Verrucomicrobia bacterium]|nr:MAG: methyltransferase domain-containing protein [Verrucomicrobiota bacterium]